MISLRSQNLEIRTFQKPKRRVPTNPADASDNCLKVLKMGSVSLREHELGTLNMGSISSQKYEMDIR